MRRAYTEGGDGAVATLVGSGRTPGRLIRTLGESVTVLGESVTVLRESVTVLGESVRDTQSVGGGIVSASEAVLFTPERTGSGGRSAVSEPDGWPVTVADDSHRTVVGHSHRTVVGHSRETPAGRDGPEHCDRTAVVANPTDE